MAPCAGRRHAIQRRRRSRGESHGVQHRRLRPHTVE
jgi:hypothetical protein